MGRFKETSREGVKETQEKGRKGIETGNDMNQKAENIKSILDGISLQDEDDTKAVRDTGHSYQENFNSAFSERVESVGNEVEQKTENIKGTVNSELGNVRTGISSLERASGVSDIGRQAAETGRASLEKSAGEYERIINDAESVKSETVQQIQSQKSKISSIFG